MLRSDPSLDARRRPGRPRSASCSAARRRSAACIVLNDPDSLGRAINKLYFQSFPDEVRAETLITRTADDIKAFAKAHGGNIILKPLQGSGGSGVFKVDARAKSNLNQMIEAIEPRRLHHRPGLCAGGEEGRHPLLPDERPAAQDRRQICRAAPGRRRRTTSASNIHAGGTAEAVEIGKTELEVAETDPAQADRRRHVPGRHRHRRRQDPRGERLLARQPRSCSQPGRRRFRGADHRGDRAQGRDRRANMPAPSTTATWRCSRRAGAMRIATYNVNGVNGRLPVLLAGSRRRSPTSSACRN